MKNKKLLSKSYWKVVPIVLATLVLVGFILSLNSSPDNNRGTDDALDSDIDLSPATEADQQRADEKKEQFSNKESVSDLEKKQKTLVTPLITGAGQFDSPSGDSFIEVRAFIPGIYEMGGTCTANFSNSSTSNFSRDVEAIKDATTTRCDVFKIARKEFPKAGEWSVTVSYSSKQAEGTSRGEVFNVD